MNKFNFYNPTRIFFGENALDNLTEQIINYNNILLIYGGTSIKKIGLYDEVIEILKNNNKKIFELSGITPNPRLDKVYEGIEICKNNNIDFILAIGGGSVIDSSKAISIGAKTDEDVWNKFYVNKEDFDKSVPHGAILTLSATGTEMNNDSVISNIDTLEKLNYTNDIEYPVFSILDPKYTYSVPKEQTVYGSIDILIHIFEQYFSYPKELVLSDYISEGIMKVVIKNLKIVVNKPNDYEARSELMWASSMALNGIIGLSKEQDWSSHNIGHALSVIYDMPHGETLSIITLGWMKYVYKNDLFRFKRYATLIFDVDPNNKSDEEIALEGINKTEEFFKSLGASTRLSEKNITINDFDKIIKSIDIDNAGSYIKINEDDIRNILTICL